ncbi:hypothetical protein GRX03_00665 [Halovenus sp. WSH3]|uniref:Uncharacterized protein n=1 Tax=Halovenus carboxidivorans TaxID=2692199 RepID=A0A6B0T4A3_9EURY|nr:hypothetical protein [Halovenus carboxidivorans]MXR50122.1 hypothetical protein [Halovenus carboxidivorans]
MDPELRWRLDLIIGLLTVLALCAAALVLIFGGLGAFGVVVVAGFLAGLLGRGLRHGLIWQRETR